AVIRPLPQMMMRADEGQVGLEDGLRGPLGEPRLVGGVDAPELRWPPGGRHADCRISAAQRSRTGSTSSALAAGRLKMARATPASRQRRTAGAASATPQTPIRTPPRSPPTPPPPFSNPVH